MGGSAWSPYLLGYGSHVPPLARMVPRFTGHGTYCGDVKQRCRDAERWTAVTAGQSIPWTPGTRASDTGKQGTHERLAGRMRGRIWPPSAIALLAWSPDSLRTWRFRMPREETAPGRRGTHERLCNCRLLRSSISRQSLRLV